MQTQQTQNNFLGPKSYPQVSEDKSSRTFKKQTTGVIANADEHS